MAGIRNFNATRNLVVIDGCSGSSMKKGKILGNKKTYKAIVAQSITGTVKAISLSESRSTK